MKRHVVAISGGKDSVAMAVRLVELYPGLPFEFVITPTYEELPDMEAHWKMLEEMLGPLTRINTMTLEELIFKKKMLPNWSARFCTVTLKVEPFIAYMEALPRDAVMYVGLRADEEGRLGILDTEINIEYPMRDWGWGIDDVWSYLDSKGIVIPERTDCGCCPLQRLIEWKQLLINHPERYDQYIEWEDKVGATLRSPGRDTWPADLRSLKAEFLSGRKLRKSKARGEKRCRLCTM